MAWKKVSKRGILVATEELTLPTGAATNVNSSAIDFIPRGRGFVVVGNTEATNTANACTVDIESAVGAAGTWSEHAEAFLSDIDTATVTAKFRPKRDDVALATAPRYRLALESAGNQTGESVHVAVIVDLSDSDSTSK